MRRVAGPLAALLVLGLPACSGDDAPSKAAFAADVERICTEARRQATELGRDASTPAGFAEAIDKVIGRMRSSMEELRELDTPDGDAGEAAERFVKATVAATEGEGIPALEDFREALEDGDRSATRAAYGRLRQIDTGEADRLARELGADDCVS